ncbi:MAG: clostripain-related cysteine peptidase [Thermoplasmata archaeon]|nr:clostripain-related cysteine peptidase [Thermoplasmata archaeon]
MEVLEMSHRTIGVCFVATLAAILILPGLCVTPNASGETVVSWTFAVYMSVDNDLEDDWESASLPSLLSIPVSPDIRIAVMVDRLATDGTELLEISGDSYQVVNTYPEMNFGDGATFSWFISEVSTLYPSEKLSVTASDHGAGWKEFSYDQTSGDEIRMPEMKAAIEDAGVFIDILSFDACLMGSIEVAYEAYTTGLVHYMVGSEESVPLEGFPYDDMLTSAALDPTRTPAQVAIDMVEGYGQHYDQTSAMSVTLSAVDILSIGQSTATFQTWCGLMHDNLGTYGRVYKDALKTAYIAFGTMNYVDMADLGDTLLADSRFSNPALRSATTGMITAIDSAVIAIYANSDGPESRGLTLYWATKGEWRYFGADYADVQFAVDTGWDDFLADYN